MADLIRIQPQVPDIRPGVPRRVVSGAGVLGQQLQETGDVFDRLQFGADQAAATRSIAEGKAELKARIDNNFATIADPDEFLTKTRADTDELYQRRIGDFNPRVRSLVDTGLGPDRVAFEQDIQHLHRTKLKDKARGDYLVAKDMLIIQRRAMIRNRARISKDAGRAGRQYARVAATSNQERWPRKD